MENSQSDNPNLVERSTLIQDKMELKRKATDTKICVKQSDKIYTTKEPKRKKVKYSILQKFNLQ